MVCFYSETDASTYLTNYYHYLIFQLLGSLVDKNSTIRFATRKILKLANLPVFKLFKLTVDALLENLETYPQVCYTATHIFAELVTFLFFR